MKRFLIFLIATSVALSVVVDKTCADDELRKVQREYNQKIKPLMETHCVDCHSGNSADAGLDLSKYETIKDLLNARKSWEKVRVRVAAREMPPEDSDPLSDQEHQTFLKWIDHVLTSVDCATPNPGRVTIRRLNRVEYRNTIRDLLGVDYRPADSFPGDDVGYGFDNIADVLSLPPILMEKYLDAAERITQQAIVDPNESQYEHSVNGADFDEAKHGSRVDDLNHMMFANGTIHRDWEIPTTGKYQIRVRAYGDQIGNEDCEVKLHVGDKEISTKRIPGTDDEPTVAEFFVRLAKGENRIGLEFTNDEYNPKAKRGERDRNLVISSVTVAGPIGRLPDSHRKLIGKPPKSLVSQRAEARKILYRFTSRAYRRRASKDEVDRLMQFYDQSRDDGEGYEVAIRFSIQAVLVSPYFLYRIESPTHSGETRFLEDFELATNLSFFIWGTMPDAELLKLADANGLKDYKVYQQQVARLLKNPKSNSLVESFVAQWLQLGHLDHLKPDPDLFPGIDAKLRRDMATETKMVIADLIRRDASILDLLETDFTFVNERLAKHYGISNVKGDTFRKVAIRDDRRLGLLTQASILTLTSNPTRTSPVKRGKWIMENLLGEEPPPPDPDAMQLEDQQELKGTLRQRMEQHRENPNCAVCHRVMDELGFALENYDAVGRWRDKEQTNRIDAHGELPDGTVFVGANELQRVIRKQMKDQFVRCLTEKMLIYALGRGLEYYDECAVDQIIERLEKNDFKFSQLVLGVVTSEPFLKRSGEE
ncbi:MAG: DUF1592 domain-containing protein [Planctomycetota bacterium]